MSYKAEEHKYDDIIDLPHYQSKKRKHMSMADRAAQFAPFAALTGYDEAVKETARQTEDRIETDEYEKAALNNKLLFLQEQLDKKLEISITYFKPDKRKEGGAYVTKTGAVKKINEYEHIIFMEDNTKIPIHEILCVEGELFDLMEDEF